LSQVPFPVQTPIARRHRPQFAEGADQLEGLVDDQWLKSFSSLSGTAAASPQRVVSVSLVDQAAAIPATNFSAIISAGLYRVTWYATTTVAGAGNVTVSISFTDHGIPKTYSGAALAGALGAFQSYTQLVTIDANTTITYGTVFVGPMQYALSLALELIP
jgi:hypothetical protein